MGRVFIIAEAGVNHNGSLDMAKKLIDVAASAGADAVKFQTFRAEKVISKYAAKAEYQKKNTSETESQLEMVKRLELDEEAHVILCEYCKKKGIEFISTPFDFESIDLLVNKLHLKRLKVPSGEITNGPFLLKIARTGKPVILSTGMSTLGEIEVALGVLAFGYLGMSEPPSFRKFKDAYCSDAGQDVLSKMVTLLHCTTEYPAPFEEVNLRAMETLRMAFGLPVGLSDHTEGIAIPIAATALGASVIEKHFTLDRNLPGPDHKASLEPHELEAMVKAMRQVERAIGRSRKAPAPSELKNLEVVRKSLVAAKYIKKGERFSDDNVHIKRPGTGLSPLSYWEILGKRAEKDYSEDENITL